MTLEGAIKLSETNDYIIYTMNSLTTGQYGVVIPKVVNGTLKMLVDLHMKSSFDGIGAGTKTREQLISEISDEYIKLKTRYVDSMLVIPMVDEILFQSIVINGDKQKMFDEVKKIGAITSELYKNLIAQGVEKQKIDQKIVIVEKKEEDKKFVAWLMEQMPNFVEGLLYNELNIPTVNVNPFVDGNSLFGPPQMVSSVSAVETPVTNTVASSSEIFGGVSSPSNPVVGSNVVASVSDSVPSSISNNGVSSSLDVPEAVSVASQPVTSNVISEASVTGGVFGQSAVSNVVQSVPVASTPVSVVEGPKPVTSSSLDATQTISTVSEKDNEVADDEDDSSSRSKSQGFVNLLILLVVLVAVTIVSIEIGKYLYGVYGA